MASKEEDESGSIFYLVKMILSPLECIARIRSLRRMIGNLYRNITPAMSGMRKTRNATLGQPSSSLRQVSYVIPVENL